MRSFTKIILAAVLFAGSLGIASAVAPNLTVHIKNQAGAGVPGTQVIAVEFGMNGPSTYTVIGTADSLGDAKVYVSTGHSYNLYYSSHGFSPSISDQFNNPEYDPNRYVFATGNNVYFSTFTLTTGLANVGRLVQEFTGASTGTVLFGGVYNMTSQMQGGSGLVLTSVVSGSGTLVVDNVPFAPANTYNVGLYDPQLNKGIGRNVMSNLGNGSAEFPGASALAYTSAGGAMLNFNQSIPPARVENTSQQGGGAAAGASVEGMLISTNSTPIGRMGIGVTACLGNQWYGWANVDENGRFQLYGLTPGVTYYLQAMGGCTWNQSGPGACYAPFSSPNYTAPDICQANNSLATANDIVYVSSDVMYHSVTLLQMPPSTGQIRAYVRSTSGFPIPNAGVNINPDGSWWPKVSTSCQSNNSINNIDYYGNQGFSNAYAVTSATGYAVLDGLPSGNYTLNFWTPFSSGNPPPYNGNGDDFTAFGNGPWGENWWQAHCYGTGVNDYRVNIDTDPATNLGQTMHVYNSSGTELGLSSITYIAATGSNVSGEVKGTVRFPGIVDLRNNPITMTLYPQGAGTGNFTALTSSGADHYDYSVKVASGIAYYLSVGAAGWGRVTTGGGSNLISLVSTNTATVDMSFVSAGTLTGTVYKPDGTVFAPATGQYLSINASNRSGGSVTQLQKDGTFVINNAVPGLTNMLITTGGSGSFNYILPVPRPSVTVVAGSTITLALNLVKSNYVSARFGISQLPDRQIIMNGSSPALTFKVIPLPAGTVLKGEVISKILTGKAQEQIRIHYSSVTASEGGPCGINWSTAGFCASGLPSPSVYDFYLMRASDFKPSGNSSSSPPYPHYTLISSAKGIIVDDAHSTSTVRLAANVQTSTKGVSVRLTPATDLSARGNATLSGTVSAVNIYRLTDYQAVAGEFGKFDRGLPIVSLYDANGGFAAAGVVVIPPGYVATYYPQLKTAFAQSYEAFKALLDGAGVYRYEIRGLAPSACYTAVVTSPNYPSYQTRVCMGLNASTTTMSVNLDTAVGAGATLQGVVTSTNAVKLANAEVGISGEGIEDKSVVTDSSGAYKFEGLSAGTVKIKVALSGYASGEADTDLTGSNASTQNFQLTAAAGSITGTVYSQKLPFSKVQPGALILAYNDTYNGNNPAKPLPLIKTKTGADGTYKLEGLIPGDTYKIFLKFKGKFKLNQSTTAIAGNISGLDFMLLGKPMHVEIFIKKIGDDTTGTFEFVVRNPQNFKVGEAKWSAYPYNPLTATALGLEKLSSGEMHGSIPASSLTPGIIYALQANATSYSNKNITKELFFGKRYRGNSTQHIDDAILGDDSDDGFGRKSNEAPMDMSGDDASALSFPAGAMLPVSSAAIPTCTFKGEGKDDAAVADKVAALGADAFAGNLYTVALSSVSINEDKGFDLTLAYDKSTADLTDLAVAGYNDATGKWDTVQGVATINPVKGTVKVKLKKLASVLSERSGTSTQSFSAFNGHEYLVRPLTTGGGSSYGTYAVIRPSVAGIALSGVKLKVFNYPNPFNLKDKAITNSGGAALPGSTYGTVIHVEVPAGNGGPGHVRIYTLAGELVRDIAVDFTSGVYNYVIWNGKNKGGQEVANGVYYGVVEMTGKSPDRKDATFKMAVIK
ncbi:MAG: carboxypeptidase regulatory-like domain-containing protein [Elusimicrobiota bacterium]|nr:carboxypeptidase regulatory-like domain-containing protein [Elusimicrobiota bacterium]